MIVPKAGMVDILTELNAAGEQNSSVSHNGNRICSSLGHFFILLVYRDIVTQVKHYLQRPD